MDQLDEIMGTKELPGLGGSLAPILIPLVLILSKTVCDFVGVDKESFIYGIVALLGSPDRSSGSWYYHCCLRHR